MIAKLHCVEETAGGLTVMLTLHSLQILTHYVIHLQRIQCDILIIPQGKKKERKIRDLKKNNPQIFIMNGLLVKGNLQGYVRCSVFHIYDHC